MKLGAYEFSLRELAGSLGDFGPLNPFVLGYIAINGLDPAGLLIMFGLVNIFVGLKYNLPLSLEPQKAIGSIAISQHWSPGMVYGAGFGTGLVWLFFYFSGLVSKIRKYVPDVVIRGVQFSLSVLLGIESAKLMGTNYYLSAAALVLLLLFVRRAPVALYLFLAGVFLALSQTGVGVLKFSLSLPSFQLPSIENVLLAFAIAGVAQIPLTLSNAIYSTSEVMSNYFPERKIPPEKLSLNMGIANSIPSFFGGIPVCHGAGGCVSQHLFGARTGGAMIMEGLLEVFLGLFFAGSVFSVFAAFPKAIIGALLLFVAFEFVRISFRREMPIFLIAIISVLANLGAGFFAGLLGFWLWERIKKADFGLAGLPKKIKKGK